ncbi:MAG: undecaprenyl/decaprenyl-phosphate alpha-N-acetylglucosaminyl 1-phosphate transferase [Actinomycetota bacterium]|nr:undecaprenyl/decaprenyl-phosphate alpha-N-acetylglucosaminyl 1-phosphate transferase [Actinomycetota bacterium]
MGGYAVVLGVAAITTYLLGFLVRRVAVRVGAVVLPDERRVHALPTPTAGGVAMFGALLLAMFVASQLPQFRPVFEGSSEPLGIVLAAGVIFVVGLVDDVREVSAPAKLAGQVLAGSVLSFLGVTMLYFRVPFVDIVSISPDLAPLLTVLWVAAIANAVNLVDGLDGLAAGVVAIAAAAFFVYADRLFKAGLLGGDNLGPLVAVIACGVCLGFLPHNFHPARMFMGDAGAMLLGLLMASSTMVVGGRTADQFSGQTYFFFAPMFIPLFVLGVPILDTAFAIVRRSVRRASLAAPDKEHLHHRLMRLGHGHRRSVVILWAWTAILSGLVLFPTFTNEGNAVIPFAAAGLVVALYTLFHPGVRQRAETEAEARALQDEMEEAAGEAGVPLADVVPMDERRRGAGAS